MADEYTIEVRLDSETLRPDNIRSRDIAELITAVEVMLAALVVQNNPQLDLKESDVTIGLAAVKRGSYRVQFRSQYETPVRKAYETVTDAIKNHKYHTLPDASVEALRTIRGISRRLRTETQFGYQNGHFVELARMLPNSEIQIDEPTIEGETVLYGQLVRIGGINPPKARLILLTGESLVCNVTEQQNLAVARELGARLYTEVGVKGLARWRLRDMKLIFFRIDELLEYRAVPLPEAINELSDNLSPYLEKLDSIGKFFADLRDKDSEYD